MYRGLTCILTFIFSPILLTLTQEYGGQDLTTTEESEEFTDPVRPDLDVFLDVDGLYGLYTTQSFEYVNWQHYHEDEPYFLKQNYYHVVLMDARCSADHIKCISNLEMPIPVCAYFWKHQTHYFRYKVFESYCHVYFENCILRHRRYRMLNYGGCYLNGYAYPTKWQYPPQEPLAFEVPYNTWDASGWVSIGETDVLCRENTTCMI